MTAHLNLDDLDVGGKEPFEFVFDGATYRCRTPEVLDIRGLGDLAELANRDPVQLLAWLLGGEQYEQLEEAPAVFSMHHMGAVLEGWFNHHELSPGKSGGPSKPAKAKKSKR